MKKVILFLVLSLTLSAVIGLAGCGLSPTTTVYGTGPAGGYIFYDKGSYSDGWRYLEAAPASTEWTGKEWGSYGTFIGGTETGIETGQSNTNTIVTWLNSHSETDRAALVCDALVYGDYSDWFLPSKDELNLMYKNLYLAGFGGLKTFTSPELVVFLVTTTGVRLRVMPTARGPRSSAITSRAATIRTTADWFGLSGLFNHLSI